MTATGQTDNAKLTLDQAIDAYKAANKEVDKCESQFSWAESRYEDAKRDREEAYRVRSEAQVTMLGLINAQEKREANNRS